VLGICCLATGLRATLCAEIPYHVTHAIHVSDNCQSENKNVSIAAVIYINIVCRNIPNEGHSLLRQYTNDSHGGRSWYGRDVGFSTLVPTYALF
jgi:hypothetical protein